MVARTGIDSVAAAGNAEIDAIAEADGIAAAADLHVGIAIQNNAGRLSVGRGAAGGIVAGVDKVGRAASLAYHDAIADVSVDGVGAAAHADIDAIAQADRIVAAANLSSGVAEEHNAGGLPVTGGAARGIVAGVDEIGRAALTADRDPVARGGVDGIV